MEGMNMDLSKLVNDALQEKFFLAFGNVVVNLTDPNTNMLEIRHRKLYQCVINDQDHKELLKVLSSDCVNK